MVGRIPTLVLGWDSIFTEVTMHFERTDFSKKGMSSLVSLQGARWTSPFALGLLLSGCGDGGDEEDEKTTEEILEILFAEDGQDTFFLDDILSEEDAVKIVNFEIDEDLLYFDEANLDFQEDIESLLERDGAAYNPEFVTPENFTGNNQIIVGRAEEIGTTNVSALLEGDGGVLAYATDTGEIIYDLDGDFRSDAQRIALLDGAPALLPDSVFIFQDDIIVDPFEHEGFDNAYTFSIQNMPEEFAGLTATITDIAEAVIDYVSYYVEWQGTLDFVVSFGERSDFGYDDTGPGMPAFGGIAWPDDRTWAAYEAQTGMDANGAEPDLGAYLLPDSSGQLTNYGVPIYFDMDGFYPENDTIPAGQHDFYSIFLHEVVHGLGVWSTLQYGEEFGVSAFDALTEEIDGAWYFVGENTVNLLGGNLKLADVGSRDHYDSNPDLGVDRGLLFEFGNYENNRWSLGELDLAMLEDLGYTVWREDDLPLVEQPPALV